MASLINKIITRILPAKRCPACRRTKEQAIAEQVERQEECPLEHCRFKREIEEAILFSKVPELLEFKVDKNEALVDDTVNLTWDLINVKSCFINIIGNVPEKGNRQIQIKSISKILLEFEAYNGDIYNSEPIEITVFPKPEITEFSISRKEILKGNSLKISWKTKNILSTYISLDGIEANVNPNDTIEIRPDKDVEIGIRFIGHLETEIQKTEKILVHEPAKLINFAAFPLNVLENENVKFSFEALNYSKAYLSGPSINGLLEITSNNSFEVTCTISNNHTVTQTYFLEIFDKVNTVLPKQSIDIVVYPQPFINSFLLSESKILIGDEIEISWNVTNVSKVYLRIDNNNIEVTQLLSYKVKPRITTDYKLIVVSMGGIKSIESNFLTIQVLYYVELDFFADKYHTIQTVPIALHWHVNNATEVLLESRNNAINSEYSNLIIVSNKKSLKVTPDKSTLYRVIAKNDLDKVESEILINVFELPKMTSINLPQLPLLNFNQQISLNFQSQIRFAKIEQSLDDNKWYYDLFTFQPKHVTNWMVSQFDNVNKRILTIINTIKHED